MKQINLKVTFATLFSVVASLTSNGQGACTQFDYYYSDINYPGNVKQSDIYAVTLADGTATLTPVKLDLPFGAHIAYSEATGLLFLVNDNNGAIRSLDPITGELGAIIPSASAMGGVTTASINEDDKLLIGRGNGKIYEVDLTTSPYTSSVFDSGADIQGGDIAFTDAGLYLASKPLGNLYLVIPEMDNILLGNVHQQVTGMTKTANGETVIVSSRYNNAFLEYSLDGGVNQINSYAAMLNGAPFTLDNGDMTSGCSAREPEVSNDPCYGFEVLEFSQGLKTNGQPIEEARSDSSLALGAPDASNAAGGFVSLGVGGWITIGFEGIAIDGPGDDILLYETSFSGNNCGLGDDEHADVELSQDGTTFVSVGSICRDGSFDIAAAGLEYAVAIRITNSASTSTADGYDVDGVVALHGCGSLPDVVEPGTCYASEVILYTPGTNLDGTQLADNRNDSEQALGEPERTDSYVFTALGYGENAGFIILGFNGAVPNLDGDDLEIVETTFGSGGCASYPEFADIYVSQDGVDFIFAKTVCRFDGFVDISDADASLEYITQIKIVNATGSTTGDGFDVDGVVALHNCEGTPTPSAEITTDEVVYDDEQGISEVSLQTTSLKSYPNPTVGASTITFITATSGKATLEVMDMNGRVVATLYNQDVTAGVTYRASFNGMELPNGIYISKLTTGTEVTIEKMMIAK